MLSRNASHMDQNTDSTNTLTRRLTRYQPRHLPPAQCVNAFLFLVFHVLPPKTIILQRKSHCAEQLTSIHSPLANGSSPSHIHLLQITSVDHIYRHVYETARNKRKQQAFVSRFHLYAAELIVSVECNMHQFNLS